MDTVIALFVAGIAAIFLIVVVSSCARFENSKSVEFRRLEAERERKWLDYQIGRTEWYDRRG